MKLGYKRLDIGGGYHYVQDSDARHLFAQWPIGQECQAEDVSSIPMEISCAEFAARAQQLAAQNGSAQ